MVVGVLDIDSPIENRFSERDCIGLEKFARIIETIWSLGGDICVFVYSVEKLVVRYSSCAITTRPIDNLLRLARALGR